MEACTYIRFAWSFVRGCERTIIVKRARKIGAICSAYNVSFSVPQRIYDSPETALCIYGCNVGELFTDCKSHSGT